MDDMRKFMAADVDGSYTLDYEEFLAFQSPAVRAKFSNEQIREWFDEADTDKNGTLDVNEFFRLNGRIKTWNPTPTAAQQTPPRPGMKDMRQFMAADKDGNQFLDYDEFVAMQPDDVKAKLGDDMKTWFEMADEDGNGVLDMNEFFQLNTLMAVAIKSM